MIFVQRSGNADDDHVHPGDRGVVGCRREAVLRAQLESLRRGMRTMYDSPRFSDVDFVRIDVEACDREALLR